MLDTGPITNHVNFANNRNGKFAYVTIGGANEVKAFRRGATPELVATIPVGELPHGIWPSGDGSRVYVALENGEHCVAIDTVTNKVIANIPIGQTTQALVYVPNAVPNGPGTENLMPLGVAANTARLHLEAGGTALPDAQASVAVIHSAYWILFRLRREDFLRRRNIRSIWPNQISRRLVNLSHLLFSKQTRMAQVLYRQSGH